MIFATFLKKSGAKNVSRFAVDCLWALKKQAPVPLRGGVRPQARGGFGRVRE